MSDLYMIRSVDSYEEDEFIIGIFDDYDGAISTVEKLQNKKSSDWECKTQHYSRMETGIYTYIDVIEYEINKIMLM